MAWYDDPAIITMVIATVVIITVSACITILYAMRLKQKKPQTEKEKGHSAASLELTSSPFKISKSVQTNTASNAKDELRILELEREILSDSIRRLYEAHAEGKITEGEREKLASTYKARMTTIKDSIAKDETIVALHELEGMQEDLMKLFSERFGELTSKVEELRTKIDVKPIKEIAIKPPIPVVEQTEEDAEDEIQEALVADEDKPKKKRKPPVEKPDPKTEAERRIESIRSEVEKVLDKLGQMEIES
jgi:hypothetical protein